MMTKYTDSDAIQALKRVNRKVDGPVTRNKYEEYSRDSDPSTGIFYSRFGGFNELKQELGMELLNRGRRHNGPGSDEWYNYIKSISRCQLCDETDDVCLQFHHLPDSEKEFLMGRAKETGRGFNDYFVESQKCAIVCANCHKRIHGGLVDEDLGPWYDACAKGNWYIKYLTE